MHISRLRLVGFKSFVEPTDLLIERGLTGVVGPNGCGKSNLLEALRWVMGETSHKSMRAAAMDDVIFSGTTTRPARNWAEVVMVLDNRARTAPAAFNDQDQIEIARRIEREAGSAYRINGRDARARDVKVLFEDAATGARSPALVRQGQIAELVNARPDQRRRILEDAAGVAGLHTRRHEAELRLKAADANLLRIGDILGALNGQVEGLKRQARAAKRYREISAEIRQLEALLLHGLWAAAHGEVTALEEEHTATLMALGQAVAAEAAALTAEIRAAEVIPGLREREVEAAAAAARIAHELDTLDRDLARAVTRRAEADARLAQLRADLAREEVAGEEALATVDRLEDTLLALVEADEDADARVEAARELGEAAAAETAAAERIAADLTRALVEREAMARSLKATLAERHEDAVRARRQLLLCQEQLQLAIAAVPEAALLAGHRQEAELGAERLAELDATRETAAGQLADLDAAVEVAREALAATRLARATLAAERDTLARLTAPAAGAEGRSVFDDVEVDAGYESALGAALGSDLDASETDTEAAHWRTLPTAKATPPAWPVGAAPLGPHVRAPAALARRLASIAVVARARGRDLQPGLTAGQRLVSLEGDLWRWDGYVASADAISPAAARLVERNRLGALDRCLADAGLDEANAGRASAAAIAAAAEASRSLRQVEDEARAVGARVAALGHQITRLEQAVREADGQTNRARAALAEAETRHDTALQRVSESEAMLDALTPDDAAINALAAATAGVAAARLRQATAAGQAAGLVRELDMQREQRRQTETELARWQGRAKGAAAQLAVLAARLVEATREAASSDLDPAQALDRREALQAARAAAEASRTDAMTALAEAETARREAGVALKTRQAEVSGHREARARVEARLEAARHNRQGEARKIRETLSVAPEDCLALAELADGRSPPPLDEVDRLLTRARADRERIGGVNLDAEAELGAIQDQFATLDAERQDVEQAVAKLRAAIGQLNREGRKRLMAAFIEVDRHFQRLFTSLFGGGEARLEMIEGEDPLEGGLEIIAKPPGKKPATLSLLSGGEQTLTALSLIFAVFLTNPSPICVLDEVDAPLDDSNVDRFCTLMEHMAADTETRFLVITHHPMTMARMDRLFGVTMGERGVSQLVSVDLTTAERLVDQDAA